MSNRTKILLIGAPIVVIALTFAAIKLGSRPSAARSVAAAKKPWRPVFFPPVPVEPKSAELSPQAEKGKGESAPPPAEKPGPHQLFSDSYEYASAIEETPEFQMFASSAALTPDQQRQVSHILALYYMDDASLQNMNTDDAAKLASMRRQLLVHMHVRVRAKIPQAFEVFEQSKLLPPVEPEPAKAGPT
jgi:hypothetical protein